MKHGQSFKTMAITINGNGTITGISVGGLPDGIVDTDMIAANAVTTAKSTGVGITHARGYRITANYTLTGANAVITANWEYDDTTSVGYLGTGWSLPSSGAFSFPTTGIFEVRCHSLTSTPGGTNTPYAGLHIIGTTDNFSAESSRGVGYFSQEYDDFNVTRYHNVHASAFFDVTDTSNVKFKIKAFRDVNYGNVDFLGSSGDNYTWVEVIRLGDT